MADLVETVARAMWFDHVDRQGYPNGLPTWDEMVENGGWMHEVEEARSNARAAIAAALDDMAELSNPSEGMMDAVRRLGSASVPKVWQAMLAQYRKEMLG